MENAGYFCTFEQSNPINQTIKKSYMKHLLIACFALCTFVATAQKKVAEVAKFSSESVDLGKVKVGNPVTGTFTVTNVGTTPLVIENVTPGCGCTKSDYTKEPIAAGKTGTITATYNAAVVGNFSKTVYVKFAGVNEQANLNVVGQVLDAATFDQQTAAKAKDKPATTKKADKTH